LAHTDRCLHTEGDWYCAPGCLDRRDQEEAELRAQLVKVTAERDAAEAAYKQLTIATEPTESNRALVAALARALRAEGIAREWEVKCDNRIARIEQLQATLAEIEREAVREDSPIGNRLQVIYAKAQTGLAARPTSQGRLAVLETALEKVAHIAAYDCPFHQVSGFQFGCDACLAKNHGNEILDILLEAKVSGNAGGLTFDELVVACKNIGYDLSCGQCASVFYTGAGTYPHECEEGKKTIAGISERLTMTVTAEKITHPPKPEK
jgi:hypothetical protein